MSLQFKISLFAISLFFLLSCNSEKKTCLASEQKPLFSAKTKGIEKYSFQKNKETVREKFRFNLFITMDFEIISTGCDELTQEIRMEFQDRLEPMPRKINAKDLIEVVASTLLEISNFDKNAYSLTGLADAMMKKQDSMEYNEAVSIGNGFSMQLDKIHDTNSTLVTIILKRDKE
jgi:hypothetical protein